MENSCKEQISRHHALLAWFSRKLDVGQFDNHPKWGTLNPCYWSMYLCKVQLIRAKINARTQISCLVDVLAKNLAKMICLHRVYLHYFFSKISIVFIGIWPTQWISDPESFKESVYLVLKALCKILITSYNGLLH